MKDRLLIIGIIGSTLTALCCFTPILPVILGGVGLSGLIGFLYNDLVLLPLLAMFLCVTGFAIWRKMNRG